DAVTEQNGQWMNDGSEPAGDDPELLFGTRYSFLVFLVQSKVIRTAYSVICSRRSVLLGAGQELRSHSKSSWHHSRTSTTLCRVERANRAVRNERHDPGAAPHQALSFGGRRRGARGR